MPVHLMVREPFGDFAKGAVISNADMVAEYRDSPHCVPFAGAEVPPSKLEQEQAELAHVQAEIAHTEAQG